MAKSPDDAGLLSPQDGDKHGDIEHVVNRTPHILTHDATMVTEICARFIEWRTSSIVITESKPFRWLQRIASLGRDNPDALWLYLQLQTGNLAALTATYDTHAKERCVDRQMIHKTHKRALMDMALHFPELRSAIADIDETCRPPRGINRKAVGQADTKAAP